MGSNSASTECNVMSFVSRIDLTEISVRLSHNNVNRIRLAHSREWPRLHGIESH